LLHAKVCGAHNSRYPGLAVLGIPKPKPALQLSPDSASQVDRRNWKLLNGGSPRATATAMAIGKIKLLEILPPPLKRFLHNLQILPHVLALKQLGDWQVVVLIGGYQQTRPHFPQTRFVAEQPVQGVAGPKIGVWSR
jgi:hypothetical protein